MPPDNIILYFKKAYINNNNLHVIIIIFISKFFNPKLGFGFLNHDICPQYWRSLL